MTIIQEEEFALLNVTREDLAVIHEALVWRGAMPATQLDSAVNPQRYEEKAHRCRVIATMLWEDLQRTSDR